MFAYPRQTEFNRQVPKTKIFAHARASKRIKELFASQVAEIVWKYKLSPETIHLPARQGIHEIQVFVLTLKQADLDDAVLETLDKAIPFPLLFQIVCDGQIRFAASYKRPSEADASKWVVEGRFITDFQPSTLSLPPLPIALDLAGLYEQLVRAHIPLPPRNGEGIMAQVTRFNTITAKQAARRQLETRLESEIQFNRKVELNAALRTVRQELADLTRI
jgi:hypothetical protein